MSRLQKKVIQIDAGTSRTAAGRKRFDARPVKTKIDYTAFARQVEAKFPILMAELAK